MVRLIKIYSTEDVVKEEKPMSKEFKKLLKRISIHGTVTGRFPARNPNFSNGPKKER